MAYFRCSSGGSGNGAVITVTYSAEFYNQTLTATNGVDTVSVVATSSGTADITVPSEGSWTVSCTIGGDTYTSDAVVVDLSYATTLTAIPDGSTVLPTDDIQTWLECAGITDKAYTLLSEVLADTDTYVTLLGDSNACDYMARSTTWAVDPNGKVPTMTDNTHPSGVASASSEYPGAEAYKAFDDTSNDWATASGQTTNQWVKYDFGEAVCVNKASITTFQTRMNNFKIQGSNDDFVNDVHDLYTGTAPNTTSDISVTFDNTDSYRYYRCFIIDVHSGSYAGLTELQFYYAGITDSALAMSILGRYDYACDVLLSDATWASAIRSSSYMDYVIDVTVPTMTSNTTPSGVVSATTTSTNPSQREPYRTFSNNTSNDGWLSLPNITISNQYLQYEFPNEVTIYLSEITNNSNEVTYDYGVNNYDIEAYDNATQSWVVIASGTVEKDTINTSQAFSTVIKKSNKYRIHCLDNHGNAGVVGINKAQFYGRHTAQADIIRSAPSDTIYYMDNGNPVTLCTTDASGVGTVDWSNLPTGDITLYSSVAKDKDDFTADYSQTITITKNKTEAWFMPTDDGLLYWYGISKTKFTPSGYGFSSASSTSYSYAFNTNNMTLSVPSSSNASFLGTESAIDLTGRTKLVLVYSLTSAVGNWTGYQTQASKGKILSTGTNVKSALDYTKHKNELALTSTTSKYITLYTNNNTAETYTIHALWLE